MQKSSLHILIWLWLPLVVIMGQLVAEFVLPVDALRDVYAENGLYEIAQVIVIFMAFIFAIRTVRASVTSGQLWLSIWAGVAALSSFYVFGEELSWGQHVLNWSTPEYWAALNDQGETNLHNTSSWLDQKPRILLLSGVFVGGLLIPFTEKIKPGLFPAKFRIIYPPAVLSVTAGCTLFIHIMDDVADVIPAYHVFGRASEIEELYMFYFVWLYLVCLRRRIVAQDQC